MTSELFFLDAEIAARHFWGLGDFEDAEERGGDVAEGATGS